MDNDRDPYDLARQLAELPPGDVVPDNPAELPPAGSDITVILPGRIIEDADGIPVGMEPNQRHTATITDTGGIAFWEAV